MSDMHCDLSCDEGVFLHRCANEQKIISKQVEFQTQVSRIKLDSERIINIQDYRSEFDRCFVIIFEEKKKKKKKEL